MEDTGMISLGDAVKAAFSKIGNVEHVEASDGDFIADDGYLCCGVCGKHKEFRRQLPFREKLFVVPCLCDCGKAEVAREEQEAKLKADRLRIQELFAYSLVDERFHESTFANLKETPDNAKAVRIARNYVAHFDEMFRIGKGLIFYGPPGTGKTFLADCIANALLEKDIPVLVTSIVALTRGMGENLPMILQKMNSAHVLILDDFGAERFTDFKSEQIFDVIDTRYSSKKPMIVTTNYSMTDMKNPEQLIKDRTGNDSVHPQAVMRQQRVNERILAACHPVKMVGESWRKKSIIENYSSIVSLLEAE